MNICILTQTFPRFAGDSAAPFMKGLSEGLHDAGNTVYVLAPFSTSYKIQKNKKFQLITYRYIYPKQLHKLGYSQTMINDKSLKKIVVFISPFMMLFAVIRLLLLVKRRKIDVISAHWILPNGFIAAIVKKIIPTVKVYSTLPGSDVYLAKRNIFFKKMALFAANNADGITSNSLQLKKDLEKIGCKIKKFKQIAYSVNSTIFKPEKKIKKLMRAELKFDKENIIVLGVGRLVEKKGFIYLVKASKNIIKKYPKTIFVLVGEGDEHKRLQKEVDKNGLTNNYIFIGQVPHFKLINYYNLCDIFILPSIRDRNGNLDDQSVSVMEAMSCAKPVITTDFPGYRLVIENNIDGYLIREKNTEDIERIIIKLIKSTNLRINIGKKARQKIQNKFSWEQIGKEYTNFFKV